MQSTYFHDFVKYNYCNELFCTEKSINRKQIVNEANNTYIIMRSS